MAFFLNGEVLHHQTGEKLASGTITPSNLDTIPDKQLQELQVLATRLEDKYRNVQDIEFAYDGAKLYMLQTRDAKLSDLAKCRISLDFFKKGWIDSTRLQRLYDRHKYSLTNNIVIGDAKPIAKGIPVCDGRLGGVVKGQICLKEDSRFDSNHRSILVAEITTTEDLQLIKDMDGVITSIGGYTSHPAVVCRDLDTACIVSAKPIEFIENGLKIKIGDHILKAGDQITMVANTGEIFLGYDIEIESNFVFQEEYAKFVKDEDL